LSFFFSLRTFFFLHQRNTCTTLGTYNHHEDNAKTQRHKLYATRCIFFRHERGNTPPSPTARRIKIETRDQQKKEQSNCLCFTCFCFFLCISGRVEQWQWQKNGLTNRRGKRRKTDRLDQQKKNCFSLCFLFLFLFRIRYCCAPHNGSEKKLTS